MEGKKGHLEYVSGSEAKGYDFVAVGGSLVGSYVAHTIIGDVGITGALGVAPAGPRTLDGESFDSWGFFRRDRCYNYSSSLGARYGFTVNEISIYAETHVSWDSVAFQRGSTQEWERFSFHTLGVGFGGGISKEFSSGRMNGMTIYLSGSYEIGLKSFTVARTRSDWETSAAVTNDIDAQSNMIKVSFGVTATM